MTAAAGTRHKSDASRNEPVWKAPRPVTPAALPALAAAEEDHSPSLAISVHGKVDELLDRIRALHSLTLPGPASDVGFPSNRIHL